MSEIFPGLNPDITRTHGVSRWLFRSFGASAQDLAIDLQGGLKPRLITDILRACTREPLDLPEAFFWDLTISERIEALLQIVFISRPGPLVLQSQCPGAACRQASELEYSLDELQLPQELRRQTRKEILIQGKPAVLRRPVGLDQLKWLSQSFADPQEAMNNLIKGWLDLAEEQPLPDCSAEEMSRLNQAVEAFDPLPGFSQPVICPHCGLAYDQAYDLESIALLELRRLQDKRLRETHQLAMAYHWSETDIFQLPAWRREYYLRLIEKNAE